MVLGVMKILPNWFVMHINSSYSNPADDLMVVTLGEHICIRQINEITPLSNYDIFT